jgi:hypothetical protein
MPMGDQRPLGGTHRVNEKPARFAPQAALCLSQKLIRAYHGASHRVSGAAGKQIALQISERRRSRGERKRRRSNTGCAKASRPQTQAAHCAVNLTNLTPETGGLARKGTDAI